MFVEILDEIQKSFSPLLNPSNLTLQQNVLDEEWTRKIDYYINLLNERIEYLQTSTHSILTCRMFKNSRVKFNSYGSEIEFLRCQIRCDGVEGILLSLSLYRPFLDGSTLHGPSLSVDLNIAGESEMTALRSLYGNYRRIIELLINGADINLIYSFSSYKPEVFWRKDIFNKLDIYFSQCDFKDKTLIFSRSFDQGMRDISVVNAFCVLSAIYDSCDNYLYKPRRYDKILNYFYKLNSHPV